MKVLDLFSGLRGWSDPFRKRGHQVFTVEIDPKFPADYRDILTFDPYKHMPWFPDIVLASPPCTAFSVMRIGKNWHYDGRPKTDKARMGLRLVRRTLDLIRDMETPYWVIENPVGKLRKLSIMKGLHRETVTYCQYGEKRMKPTDLWGEFPEGLVLKERCSPGAKCHVAAPRGSYTGTQGMDPVESAKIPKALALAFCKAMERIS